MSIHTLKKLTTQKKGGFPVNLDRKYVILKLKMFIFGKKVYTFNWEENATHQCFIVMTNKVSVAGPCPKVFNFAFSIVGHTTRAKYSNLGGKDP